MEGAAFAKSLRSKEANVIGDSSEGEQGRSIGPEMQQRARSHGTFRILDFISEIKIY